jgi:hypothetical protein
MQVSASTGICCRVPSGIVALFQLILLCFVGPIPLLEAFACDAAALPIWLLLRMHGDVSFEMSKLFRHGFLQHFAIEICRAILQDQCLQQSGLISKLGDA